MPGTYETGTQEQLINNLAGDAQAKPAGMFGSNMSPEMFAIILDSIGKGMDPKNPMAGIGTGLAQSSMASQERNKNNAQMQEWMKALTVALAKGHTIAEEPGINSTKTSTNPDGTLKTVIDINPGGASPAPGVNSSSGTLSPIPNAGTLNNPRGIDLSPFY